MHAKHVLLSLAIVPSFLMSCNTTSGSYTLTFYQPHGNRSDNFTVNIGKTTLDEIKKHADSLENVSKPGYDRTWDWDNYDFANQKEDWTITAINPLHNYKISFTYDGVEKGSTTYTIKDSDYSFPSITSEQKGYEYIEKEHLTIEGKKEDLVSELNLQKCTYKMRFFTSEDDKNPTVVEYNIDNTKVTAPKGPEGYISKWETKDGKISFDPEEQKEIKVDDLGNYDLYLNKDGIPYTITLKENGGSLDGEKTLTIKHGDPYELPTPKFLSNGKVIASFLGWFDSKGNQVPTSGDCFPVIGDQTLIARYFADFETENQKDALIPGTRTSYKEPTLSDEKTHGEKSLVITSTDEQVSGSKKGVLSCSFNADFLKSAFDDPNVVAINFDAKASDNCTKLSYQNTTTSPYEYNCCTKDEPGYGLQTEWKTFSLTKEMYNKASDKGILLCTVGNQMPVGGKLYIDNVRPVTNKLDLLGFEGSRIVPKDDTSSHYKKSVSFRDFNNAELFCITTGYTDAIKFGFDYEYKSEGLRSIHYEHKASTNVWLTLPQLNLTKVKEVTFDICLSKAYNGNTVRDGNGKELFPSTKVYQAYEWVTFTVSASQISDAKQFCTVTSSVECDFWVDNIKIVNTEA